MNRKLLSSLVASFFAFSLITPIINVNAASSYNSEYKVKGSLLIVGGALGTSNKDIYNKFIDLAGGKLNSKIGIIPSASSKLQSSNDFKSDLINYGVPEDSIEIIPISKYDFKGTEEDESITWKNNENSDSIISTINNLTGIWMVGGDQTHITDTLRNEDGSDTKALKAIWDVYRDGGVIGGSSAGAAVMSEEMIVGGDSLGTLTYGFTSSYEEENQNECEPASVIKGLGFFKYGVVDQHFDEKARLGRLVLTTYEKSNTKYGFGIDEDTALILNNEKSQIEVAGRGGVTIVDTTSAMKNPSSAMTDMDNINLSYMMKDDLYDLTSKSLIISKDKLSTTGYEYYNFKPTPYRTLIDNVKNVTDFISYNLIDNMGTNSIISYLYDWDGNGFKLTFSQDEKSEGYYGNNSYSFENIKLDITPVNVTFNTDYDKGNYSPMSKNIQLINANPDEIKGSLVIVGGALDPYNKDIYESIISLAGGIEKAKIGILPTASQSLSSSESYKRDFVDIYGLPDENVIVLPLSKRGFKEFSDEEKTKWSGNENSDDIVNMIKGLTGIFMVGGSQDRITSTLYNSDGTNSKALDAMWEIYKNGAVLSGSSAGAAVMSDVMLNGGDSFGILRDGYTDNVDETYGDDIVKSQIVKGLGFFPYGIVDQHFITRNRLGRLIQTTYETNQTGKPSFGIDENTALVVHNPTKSCEVIGTSGVVVLDMKNSTTDSSIQKNNYSNIKYSFLKSGDSMNLVDNTFKFKEDKYETRGYEYYNYKAEPNSGVMSGHGSLNSLLSYKLIDNAANSSVTSYGFDNTGKGFKLTFNKLEDSNGYWCYSDGQKDDYSLENIGLDITPIKAIITNNISTHISPINIHIVEDDIQIKINETIQLHTIIDGTNALNKDIIWSSSNPSIVTVDSKGLVKAISPGISNITATTVDGNKTDSIKVTVAKTDGAVTEDDVDKNPEAPNKPGDKSNNIKNNTTTLPQTGKIIGTGSLYIISMILLSLAYITLRYNRKSNKPKK